eukprot:gb/GFBE01078007.1/.p1 GENE.gb/GFBE01078007.1/~~gb/GFBE01078007.1/.p1  ORF type:complete len:136 (+),score=2.12 gb/GFBE01078007.1/:1-408(+)
MGWDDLVELWPVFKLAQSSSGLVQQLLRHAEVCIIGTAIVRSFAPWYWAMTHVNSTKQCNCVLGFAFLPTRPGAKHESLVTMRIARGIAFDCSRRFRSVCGAATFFANAIGRCCASPTVTFPRMKSVKDMHASKP